MESRPAPTEPAPASASKRPRSPSGDFPPIASKIPKTISNHLQINYLARQYPDNLPLVAVDDNMSAILHLIGEYDGVLQRHESIAGNLGACPLGPILIKRFERLFDGPPRVLKSHGKDPNAITWLDVVEFAKNKPEQFNLEKSRNGVRVCQFYTKQCRVEISEEDFVLIASGMPQKMIPPQPIIEDEEKELGALEILEKNLQQIVSVADQVSARARQLNHRLKNRRTAIIARRENDANLHIPRSLSPVWREANGYGAANPHSPSTGFVAVNTHNSRAEPALVAEDGHLPSPFMFSHSNTENVTIINGTSIKGASPTTRAELMKKFFTTADRQARGYEDPPAATQMSRQSSSRPRPRPSDASDYNGLYNPSPATVAIPNTPSSLLPPPKSNQSEKDDGGPFKIEMVTRMEELQRGERIMPPCDRCRRLHMDCLKNLTACMGCTKKHAKCSWKDVKEEELQETRSERPPHEVSADEPSRPRKESISVSSPAAPVPASTSASTPAAPVPASILIPASAPAPTPLLAPDYESARNQNSNMRRESAPTTAHGLSGPSMGSDPSPRRAMSEIHGGAAPNHDRRVSLHRRDAPDDDDPDANQRLMQAIWDTVDHHSRGAAPGPTPDGKSDVSQDRERKREREREREHKMVKA